MSNNSIQESLQYWKQFDLPGLQKELDEKANELANRQDESESSRKKLVEFCKEFKKTTPEDIKKVVTPVLKCFQSEVDNLSKRSKAAEAAFLTVYKKIIDANDPVTSLDYCLNTQKKWQKTQDLEIENTNLRETLHQYNKELADVKNQEITIRQLREKIRNFEDQMESLVKQKITEKEQSLMREYEEKQKRLQDEKYLLERKCKESEQKVQSIEQTLNAVQQELFTLKSKSDDLGHTHSSEMEILASDLEKANLRAASAEKECETLREKLHNDLNGHGEDGEFSNSKESDPYFRSSDEAKDRQISQLLEEINQVKTQYEHELTEKASQVDTLQEKLNDKICQIDQLHSRVNSHKDYEEIKQELNVLKSVYLGNDNDDDQSKNVNSSAPRNAPRSLDLLLLEKNKSLQLDKTALLARKRELENRRRRAARARAALLRASANNALRANNINSSGSHFSTNNDAFQNIACLIGSEIVTQAASSSSSNNSLLQTSPKTPFTAAKPLIAVRAAQKLASSSPTAFANAELPLSLEGAYSDLDDALSNGVPREVIECIAIKHLQEALNKRMTEKAAKFNGRLPPVETFKVAVHCRQVLNDFNIGQRLLAKCVLGQSQGAVSELLSKPKTWEKLTEKGKESFRRIEAWLADEPSISILRLISPKRVYGGFRDRYPIKVETPETRERIKAILTAAREAQKRVKMQAQQAFSASNDYNGNDTSPSSSSKVNSSNLSHSLNINQPKSAAAAASSRTPKNFTGRYKHDDIPKSMIFEIYKRELAKLREQQNCYGLNQTTVAPAPCQPHRNRRKAQRVSRISPSRLFRAEEAFGGDEKSPSSPPPPPFEQSPLAFFIESNYMLDNNEDAASDGDFSAGANGLLDLSQGDESSATSPTSMPKNFRAIKAILPPVTPEQFEKYGEISTEQLVHEIKEYLCKFSISQRLFGEQVLGLSQGSVSDLLARPKPWSSLTQKGREPFVRMKLFLNDEQAIKSLMEKRNQILLFQQQRSAHNQLVAAGISNSPPPSQNNQILEENSLDFLIGSSSPSASNNDEDNFTNCEEFLTSLKKFPSNKAAKTPKLSNSCSINTPQMPDLIVTQEQVSEKRRQLEMNGEIIDTENLVKRVKECLLAHNIGQKVFGQAVLGMSQGAVSDLLSKSKTWSGLSFKGKEAFIRMQIWREDVERIEKIVRFRVQRTAAKKYMEQMNLGVVSAAASDQSDSPLANNKKRPSTSDFPDILGQPRAKKSLVNNNNNNNNNHASINGSKSCHQNNASNNHINDEQKELLRKIYEQNQEPDQNLTLKIAQKLNLSFKIVSNWFNNRNMRRRAAERLNYNNNLRRANRANLLFASSQKIFDSKRETAPLEEDEDRGGALDLSSVDLQDDLQKLLSVLQSSGEGGNFNREEEEEEEENDEESSIFENADFHQQENNCGENRSNLIDRLQTTLNQSSATAWGDEENDRSAALERLESHVKSDEERDGSSNWEF
uniref:Homeobox protein cut-like n=1 Tax=Romanomermis culicivorax TaxID=13658 RepID=A0A915HU97_ROMCU